MIPIRIFELLRLAADFGLDLVFDSVVGVCVVFATSAWVGRGETLWDSSSELNRIGSRKG
jgi:hypothetical protein